MVGNSKMSMQAKERLVEAEKRLDLVPEGRDLIRPKSYFYRGPTVGRSLLPRDDGTVTTMIGTGCKDLVSRTIKQVTRLLKKKSAANEEKTTKDLQIIGKWLLANDAIIWRICCGEAGSRSSIGSCVRQNNVLGQRRHSSRIHVVRK
jgi:hypothetical protein